MAHGTAQHAPRVAAQLQRLEGVVHTTHRAYLDHLAACAACASRQTRCADADALWAAYTAARAGQR
ncbi:MULTISPECIES: hypothetical protein [unclassified Streptomyces]|uniref:hypothetical protein n=1 Tax=unclassified Streptomyces TaxID=2593676 RepID=UPI001319FCDF|nr:MULTISPECIES: hypothetical protein [unclassified Streptomyces]MYX36007.1 hypothetical protein [Streptomyces sp. SID8377]